MLISFRLLVNRRNTYLFLLNVKLESTKPRYIENRKTWSIRIGLNRGKTTFTKMLQNVPTGVLEPY